VPITLFETGSKDEKQSGRARFSITVGVVTNNTDCIMVGKVLIRIPSLDQEVWARLASTGAGAGTGHFQPPNINDEVLVALNDNDPNDAFVIGGLWSTLAPPPISLPTEVLTKRVIKTGLKAGLGHEVEFDDGPGQSITITTSTKQKITIDPFKIELSNTAGTLKITLDNKKQSIVIAAAVSLELTAAGSIKLSAANIEIGDMAKTVKTTVQGKQVWIN
jgi:uncharacterized protein involved in type VI secretion and phage assembly